ncbi:unnamed protein product [Pedinophyceae sp. YPF-701]|nr:unnamed protein product [Pedinophyceae sp. YPF-701]
MGRAGRAAGGGGAAGVVEVAVGGEGGTVYGVARIEHVLKRLGFRSDAWRPVGDAFFRALADAVSRSHEDAAASETRPAEQYARGAAHSLPLGRNAVWSLGYERVGVTKEAFFDLMEQCILECKPGRQGLRRDLEVIHDLESRSRAVAIVLCGTCGTGKSTLAALVASWMGINNVLSTDTVRNTLRALVDDPILRCSTYDAHRVVEGLPADTPPDKRVIKGYKAQSALVMEHTRRAVLASLARGESIVVEGIHLRPRDVVKLALECQQQQAPRGGPAPTADVIPFLVHTRSRDKHLARFAVRAKHLTLHPSENRYVAHFDEIRAIQGYLLCAAAKHRIPALNNTSTDRSLNLLVRTVLQCLRASAAGVPLIDGDLLTVPEIEGEFKECRAGGYWGHRDALTRLRAARAMRAEARGGECGGAGESPEGSVGTTASTVAATRATVALSLSGLDDSDGEDDWLRKSSSGKAGATAHSDASCERASPAPATHDEMWRWGWWRPGGVHACDDTQRCTGPVSDAGSSEAGSLEEGEEGAVEACVRGGVGGPTGPDEHWRDWEHQTPARGKYRATGAL